MKKFSIIQHSSNVWFKIHLTHSQSEHLCYIRPSFKISTSYSIDNSFRQENFLNKEISSQIFGLFVF
jgi:hypothetical protein